MTLENLGYNINLENYYKNNKNLSSFEIGRVISEHRERYIVKTIDNEFDAEIIGNLRFSAKNRYDFPAVGDWVAISEFDKNKAIIYVIFPRKTILDRQAVGKSGEKQIIATNIDYAFIVQAIDNDFNINRIERYLTICNASKVEPIIILSKVDLIGKQDLDRILEKLQKRVKNISIITVSSETQDGYKELKSIIKKGKTYCLLGSSGVGKSTLLNNISDKELMKTNSISLSSKKGRHITTHRELIVLETGGIIIDNPGMREIGIADISNGLEITYDEITKLSQNCRFKDCSHIHEKGCAIIEALDNGIIDKASYDNYLKMEIEKKHFVSSVAEKRQKDKDFGKMYKNFKNNKHKY
ncbi:MAG: ribosome small subunit-dependent GTPase A [Bacteroidetes bacterium 4572_128]|nr:MAG: ribosome small subunit-dependent GTPase A [Bacteroidetes bacterium 4572_128]